MLEGTKIGRYEIRRKIGAGGMGEVYLAHDNQLDRNVALKVLLPEFCCDLERVERFKLEAKAASTLNHPNIITIHEIDELDDKLFIATEFVDGDTLREKIEKGDITLIEAINIAEQVADALSVAHEAFIIHRDIKPENIMIRHDGYAKILDFGLAKPTVLQHAGAEDETIRLVKTQPGIVMGSVKYMSPEQARGKETDERTDVWSLGVVLYETLTGNNPFDGETISDSLAALIHIEPPPVEDVPEELQRIIRKTLRKDPADRYQSIKDFALDLRDLRAYLLHNSAENVIVGLSKNTSLGVHNTSESKTLIHRTISAENTRAVGNQNWIKTQVNTVSTNLFARRYLSFGAVLLTVMLATGAWFFLPSFFNTQAKFESIQVNRLTDSGADRLGTISPDGKWIAYINSQDGRQSLKVRQVATGSSVEVVAPTVLEFFQPTFSSDGNFIYYVLYDKGVGTLYQVSTLGGQSKKLIVDTDSTPTFSPDGKKFAFIRHSPTEGGDTIIIANSDGSEPQPFFKTKEAGLDKFLDVAWSNDGRKMLIGTAKSEDEQSKIVRLATIELDTKNFEYVSDKSWMGAKGFQWLKDDAGVLFIGKPKMSDTMQIWRMDFSNGEFKQVTSDTSDYASLSLSADTNLIVATKMETISSFWSYAPASKELKQMSSESKTLVGYWGVSHTPDGKVLFSKRTGDGINIFSMNEDGTSEKQITTENGINFYPRITPDGKYIVFTSNRGGTFGLWRMDADGNNPFQLTNVSNGMDFHARISPDSKNVIFMRQGNDGGKSKIMRTSIEGGQVVEVLPNSYASNLMPQVSPNGKRLAYMSFQYEGNPPEFHTAVKVVGFNGESVDTKSEEIELNVHPQFEWSPDGNSLTFANHTGIANIWNISLDDKKEKPLTEFTSGSNINNFTWARDGKRLFIVRGIINSDLILIKDTGNG